MRDRSALSTTLWPGLRVAAIIVALYSGLLTASVADQATKNPGPKDSQPSLDQYGGIVAFTRGQRIRLAEPAKTFRLTKEGHQWMFVTPEGNGFISVGAGLLTAAWGTGVDRHGKGYPDYAQAKYAIGQGPKDGFDFWRDRWAYYARERLKSWGFNTIGGFSYPPAVPDYGRQPEMPSFGKMRPNLMPHAATERIGGDAMRFAGVKNIYGPVFAKFWNPYFPDVFDPVFANSVVQAAKNAAWAKSPWVTYVFMDQTDQLRGVEASHPHLGFVVASTNFAIQSDPHAFGGSRNYSDPKIYSKYALRDLMEHKYHDLRALNAAWGTSYTTWDSNGGWGKGSGFLDEDGTHLGNWTDVSPAKPSFPTVRQDLDLFAALLMRQFYRTTFETFKQYHPAYLLCTNNMGSPKSYVYDGLVSDDGNKVFADLIEVSGDPDAPAAYMKLKRPFLGLIPSATAENDSPLAVVGTVDGVSFDTSAANQNNWLIKVACNACDFWWAGNPNYKVQGYVFIQFSSLPATLSKDGGIKNQFYRVMQWISPKEFSVASADYHTGTFKDLQQAIKVGDRFKRVVYFHPYGPFETQQARGQAYARTVRRLLDMQAPNGDRFYVGVNDWSWMDTGWADYFEAYNFGLVTLRDNAYDGKEARVAAGTDSWGFRTGSEDRNYGDFISEVREANAGLLQGLRKDIELSMADEAPNTLSGGTRKQ